MRKITQNDITAVILAGGQGKRLNFKDKGLILLNNKPLVSYAADIAKKNASTVLISANQNLDKYQQFGKVVSDNLPNFQGPLAGVLSAMSPIKTNYLLVLPCDSPFVNQSLIDGLIQSMQQSNTNVCVASFQGKIQPTFCLINVSLKHNLEQFLASGERKFGHWLQQNQAVEVDFSDQKNLFINLNSAEDFTRFGQ